MIKESPVNRELGVGSDLSESFIPLVNCRLVIPTLHIIAMRQTPGLLILPPGVDHQEVQILSRQLTPRLSPAHAECLLTKFLSSVEDDQLEV